MRYTLHITLLCATLMAAASGLAQTPDQTSVPLSAPVDTPMKSPTQTQLTGPKDARADTLAADSTSVTDGASPQTPRVPATPETATPETAASELADTSPPKRTGDLTATAPASGTPPDPLNETRRRWRGAVAGGGTDLGFRAWVIAALGQDEAHALDSTDPNAGTDQNGPSGDSDAPASETPPSVDPIDSQASRTRDISGRWLARAGPVALGAAGRVVTTFGAAIPTAFCAPLIVCYIELEPGEVLTDTPSWGDTARWQVTVKIQGNDPETVVLEIKPAEDAGLTNLVIPTDRRLYTINLVNDSDVHTPILSFSYPDTAARVAATRITARKADKAAATAHAKATRRANAAARKARLAKTGVHTGSGLRDPGKLDFRFSVTGKAPFRPVRVYTDGRKTYIDLHPNYRGTLPTVVPGKGAENKALNSRVAEGGRRLVVDRVIRDIWLQAGTRKVRIRRSVP